MKEQVEKFILNNLQKRDISFLEELNKLGEEQRQQIEQLNLTIGTNRENLAWLIQGKIEKTIFQESVYDELQVIIEKFSKYWNETESLQLSDTAVEHLILSHFKSPAHRKAFAEICEGDFESAKFYIQEPLFFAQYLVRQIASYENIQQRFFFPMFKFVFSTYFTEDARAVYTQTLKSLNVYSRQRNGQILVGKAMRLASYSTALQLPFIPKFEKLYKKLYENGNKKHDKMVTLFMNVFVYKTEELHSYEQRNDGVKSEQHLPKQEVTKEQRDAKVAVQHEAVIEKQTVTEGKHVSKIDAIIAQLQQLKDEIAVASESPTVNEQHDAQLKIAEEEITRLRQTIANKDAQLLEVKGQTIEQLIGVIGGTHSNYLLSDLYKESVGESPLTREMVQGQLSNLFNVLGSYLQLEPVTNGYSIGEQFTCERAQLAQQYRVLSNIEGEKATLHLQLLQYGWSVNGKVVVQPLVAQLKEVH